MASTHPHLPGETSIDGVATGLHRIAVAPEGTLADPELGAHASLGVTRITGCTSCEGPDLILNLVLAEPGRDDVCIALRFKPDQAAPLAAEVQQWAMTSNADAA